MLQTTVVHDQHDEIHAFNADLQTPAATTNGYKCGSAPAFRSAAGGHATSVLAAKDKAALEQVRHDDDAFCTAQHFFWNAFVGCRHDGLQNVHGFLHTLNCVFPI